MSVPVPKSEQAMQANVVRVVAEGVRVGDVQKSEQAMQANVVFAISLLNEGHSPEAVQAKMVERGLSEEEAAGVVCDLLMQSVYAEAVDLLNKGLSPEQVRQQLAAKGLDQETASAVVRDILAQNVSRQAGRQDSGKDALLKFVARSSERTCPVCGRQLPWPPRAPDTPAWWGSCMSCDWPGLPWEYRTFASTCFVILGMVAGVALFYNPDDFVPLGESRGSLLDIGMYGLGGAMVAVVCAFLLSIGSGLLLSPVYWIYNPDSAFTLDLGLEWKKPVQPPFLAAMYWVLANCAFLSQFAGVIIGLGAGVARLLLGGSLLGAVLVSLFGGSATFGLFRLPPWRRRPIIFATFFSTLCVPLFAALFGAIVDGHLQSTLLKEWNWLLNPILVALVSLLFYWLGSSQSHAMEPTDGPVTRIVTGLLVGLPATISWLCVGVAFGP